jgi:hypothetical protein
VKAIEMAPDAEEARSLISGGINQANLPSLPHPIASKLKAINSESQALCRRHPI